MNYIYDVIINFKYPLYDFYDWNINDNINNIKRIPLFRIKKSDLLSIKDNKFIVDQQFLKIIKKHTLLFPVNSGKKIKNACVFADNEEAIAFLFNEKGYCTAKSHLLLDEEQEVISSIKKINYFNIKYSIVSNDMNDLFKTRKEIRKIKFFVNQIKKIDNDDKLNYIYYECFNSFESNPKNKLISNINNFDKPIYEKLSHILQLFSVNKN